MSPGPGSQLFSIRCKATRLLRMPKDASQRLRGSPVSVELFERLILDQAIISRSPWMLVSCPKLSPCVIRSRFCLAEYSVCRCDSNSGTPRSHVTAHRGSNKLRHLMMLSSFFIWSAEHAEKLWTQTYVALYHSATGTANCSVTKLYHRMQPNNALKVA